MNDIETLLRTCQQNGELLERHVIKAKKISNQVFVFMSFDRITNEYSIEKFNGELLGDAIESTCSLAQAECVYDSVVYRETKRY